MTTLFAKTAKDDDGLWAVRAPCVGVWSSIPEAGTPVGPGSRIGTLRQLNRSFELRLPEGPELPAGHISDGLPQFPHSHDDLWEDNVK